MKDRRSGEGGTDVGIQAATEEWGEIEGSRGRMMGRREERKNRSDVRGRDSGSV